VSSARRFLAALSSFCNHFPAVRDLARVGRCRYGRVTIAGQTDTTDQSGASAIDLTMPFRVPGDRLASHRDFASTSCPRKNVDAELPRWRALIDGGR
jgi:hypothetical protein